MKILTAQEMKEIERRCVEEYGIPTLLLMENAGIQVALALGKLFAPVSSKKICILAGPGNNGGDGFVVARHLKNRGAGVTVYHLCGDNPSSSGGGDAALNFAILRKMGVEPIFFGEENISELAGAVGTSDVVVDALFGTGVSRPLDGAAAFAVSILNRSGKPVVSIDIPSGINADTGKAMGEAVRARHTVALGFLKRGHVLHPGASHAGEVEVADIAIPRDLANGGMVSYVAGNERQLVLARRALDSHKGTFGHLLLVAGSAGKTGAACMAAESAMRVGTGRVSVAVPKSLNQVMENKLTEAMTIPLPETKDQCLSLQARRRLMELVLGMSAVAVGPGLSTHPETAQLVRDLIRSVTAPLVLDADGITALADDPGLLAKAQAPVILTPHPGEMARLVGASTTDVQNNRLEVAREFARKHGVFVVLKGAGTIIAAPDGILYVNSTGNPGMATAGTGDVLCGMIAGFLAQGIDAMRSALLAVYLHGLAGDIAASEVGVVGMVATDIIGRIPTATRSLLGATEPGGDR